MFMNTTENPLYPYVSRLEWKAGIPKRHGPRTM
jgi:hypothetical protein